jgi:NAD(P)-dependent dehydrogenase (short-subunit alcohol dehydrogenase family)
MTDEDWLRVIAVNLSGAFFLSQTALEHMMGAAPAGSSISPPPPAR